MRRIIDGVGSNFDLIYTYDEKEAKLFDYYPTVYSMVMWVMLEMIKRKCFFVVAKDRFKKLDLYL